MAPTASIFFPTRDRRDYLAVALASVAPPGRRARRGGPGRRGRRTGAGDRARWRSATAPATSPRRPRRHQRRAQRRRRRLHRGSDLLPRRRRRGLARLARRAARARDAAHDAFGGPIRPRLEGTNLHACGREPLPVTALDLGPGGPRRRVRLGREPGAAPQRRSSGSGRSTSALGGAGDEEDWQRRLRAAGGRVGYVAAAGVDHRRAGRDARLGRCPARPSTAAAPRAATTPQGHGPAARRRVRTLAGCVWHAVRRRCGVGIVLAALSLGRLPRRSTRRPRRRARPPRTSSPAARARSAAATALIGAARDLRAGRAGCAPRRLARAARRLPRARVHVVGVARPEHLRTVARLRRELARSRHDVALHLAPPAPGAGKWANVNAALAAAPPAAPTGC